VRAQVVKILTDAKVKTIDMGLKDDLERDKLDADIAIKAGELATKGFELDQNAVQMAIDATRPEAEKASTENIPEPGPAMFPQPEPVVPPDAPAVPPGPPTPQAPLLKVPGAPPKLDLPQNFGKP
jgi:hypothetical protein